MAISLSSLRKSADIARPPRMLIYGPGGVGKTTFAACAPEPVFVWTEEGEGILDVTGFPLAKSFDEVMEALGALFSEEHAFRTLVVDSLDWLEPLVWAETCRRNGWKDIEAPGYGRGYIAAVDVWREYLEGLAALRDERNMAIIQIAHADIKRFENPETEPYDRYIIKLHQRAAAIMHEHSDVVGFAQYKINTVKTDLGFNKRTVRAVGQGDRLLYTGERPAFLAKNRYGMPDTVPLDWAEVAKHIPFFTNITAAAA